ncbi:medium-chain acyl-[acyl-carrier-protein] hydrolase [Paraburkholderia sp. Clong3]|uniref:Medium-chain acyl-[acyl-carrier-protein] hydrolase n=1 Tax=Paraburkholderia tuberum TaxID=157910 RepID=A0A1H1KL76_9BURK|nr:alpha/beta fold hydrolase [Paraburkholderia tuberum]SDR62499.1 medium-chain acyl-[acyl-carrier-protein] hydrolase [Paraburkholderia tuberum]
MNSAPAMTNPWFPSATPTAAARMSLFCFAHAGAGASTFRGWSRALAPAIDVFAVQLPGRENRLDDVPFSSMDEAADEIAVAMAPYLDRPFALFGHSMGAAIASELATRLAGAPVHLFVSSWPLPNLMRPRRLPHRATDAELLDAVCRYGGMPDALLRYPEFAQEVVRVLRADMTLLDTYRPSVVRPGCPVTVFGGADDPIVRAADLERWHACERLVAVRVFPGGHFYLRDAQRAVLDAIARQLSSTTADLQ